MGKVTKCKHCQKTLSCSAALSRHLKTFHKALPSVKFLCNKCDKEMTRKDNLEKHQRKCQGKKELVCKICGKEFKYEWYTRRHVAQCHNNENKQTNSKKVPFSVPNDVFYNINMDDEDEFLPTMVDFQHFDQQTDDAQLPTMASAQILDQQFQPLDLTVNKLAKSFIQNQYNNWFSTQVAHQLKKGKSPANIKVSSKLSDLKPFHTGWIKNLYDYMQGERESICNGFKDAGVLEAINDAQKIYETIENPFR